MKDIKSLHFKNYSQSVGYIIEISKAHISQQRNTGIDLDHAYETYIQKVLEPVLALDHKGKSYIEQQFSFFCENVTSRNYSLSPDK